MLPGIMVLINKFWYFIGWTVKDSGNFVSMGEDCEIDIVI